MTLKVMGIVFSAIAFSLLTQQTVITAKLPTYFADKTIAHASWSSTISTAFARQWKSGCTITMSIKVFLCDCTVLEEAPKCLKDFYGKVANVMVLAVTS